MASDYISLRPAAYWKGRDAWTAGLPLNPTNPYAYGTPEHYAWAAGWLGADVGEAAVIERP